MLSSLFKVAKKIMNGFDNTVLLVPIEITTLYTQQNKQLLR